ncbi:helix-turn-helix domain-containing protein, partial [Moraxella catarrhalis]|uniref:helix-turn-helix domain-containing protein n=1 Tax=Moraxella catarrhalis TaxID=480 RepID=UPI0002029FEC
MELKNRLKHARKAKGLTQKQVTEQIKGLSQSAYSQLESGKSKSTTRAVELAHLFGVDVHWLISGEGEMTKNNDKLTPITEWDDSTPLDDDEVGIPFYKDIAFACGHGAV